VLFRSAKNIPPVVKEKCKGTSLLLRLALVPFRDLRDAALPCHHFVEVPINVTSDTVDAFNDEQTVKLLNALNALKAEGGGDIPEDVFGALRKCTQLAWSARVRYAVLITDAPPHGVRFIGNGTGIVTDDYPLASNDAEDVVEMLVEK